MKKIIFQILIPVAVVSLLLAGCTKDLDRLPTNDLTSEDVYSTKLGYQQALAKVYGSMALTGNSGPAGNGDIQDIDEGTSDFVRLFWKLQEVVTDEAVIAWGDPGLPELKTYTWTSNNVIIQGLYYRIMYAITLSNAYIAEAAKAADRGFSGADLTDINRYGAEARFIRAFQYWAAMDLFGNPPFATEVSTTKPAQIKSADLFKWIEEELKAMESQLADPRTNEYGRADKAAVWSLLARLYLNAEVYTGSPRYADAITYSKKVIDAGYTLTPTYKNLFLADNNVTAKNELILTVNYDGLKTKNYGGTTFLVHGSIGNGMTAGDFGVNGGWFGIRAPKTLPALFPGMTSSGVSDDKRGQFVTTNIPEIDDVSVFAQGYPVTKFRNKTSAGVNGSDGSGDFVDTDFPLFRLAEMYLIYAEAAVRTNGDKNLATTYINELRKRAYGSTSGNISVASLNADLVLDERARELHWEGHRRTDLIRYKRFTEGTYLWPWKGGSKNGQSFASFRKLYPLPASDLLVNDKLVQNPNY